MEWKGAVGQGNEGHEEGGRAMLEDRLSAECQVSVH